MLRTLEDKVVGQMTDEERTILRHAAFWFFLVLFGYYILRPIREQISSTYGIKNLAWLFRATFITMLVAIPTYSALVSKFHRRKLVPAIYAFFIVSLLGFWAAMKYAPAATVIADAPIKEWVARILFIWISVYGLFVVSFFWSVVGDMFSTQQGRRLFGFVAGGGTAGGLLASLIVTNMVERVGEANLLLLPAVLLVVAMGVYFSLEKVYSRSELAATKSAGGKATGGNPFAGFTAVFGSKYLFAICIYGLLLATCGTTIYFQQSEIVNAAYDVSADIEQLQADNPDITTAQLEEKTAELKLGAEAARTSFFASVNFWVTIVTLLLQTAVVGRLMKVFGLGITLAVLPAAYIFGISSLAIAPTLAVLAVISVTGRAAEYAIANPAREVLFTAVKREDRYKAKSFIDTVVRRGGDTMVGSVYRALRDSWGLAMTTLSWCVVPIAICWVGLGLFIGRENAKVNEQLEAQKPAPQN